ncbi:MAG: tetratricopeptide repeat protein [Phycisphaerales bacterium]|nr:tetratricopeptide repeat protein [Phycisphaerales bacterium]
MPRSPSTFQPWNAGRLKNYAAAVPTLEKLLEREPENQHIRYTLAQTYTMAGKFDQAITILDKLHAIPGPHAGAVANDLAYLLAEHRPDRMDEAYNLAKGAVEKYGNNPAILDTLGWVLHLRGKSQESLQPLGRAVAALPNVADVHYHIGSVYQKLGNTDWARYHLEEAARDKENPIAPRAAAAARRETVRHGGAIVFVVTSALETMPSAVDTLNDWME